MLKRSLYIVSLFLVIISTGQRANAQDEEVKKSAAYDVKRMPFNKNPFNDISPVIVNDGIIFCSDRRFSSLTDRTTFNNERLLNLYYAQMKDSTWGSPKEIKSEFSSRFNNGSLSLASNGKTVYFSSDVEKGSMTKKKSFKDKNKWGIFIGELSGSTIVNALPFKYNSKDLQYNIIQPSISSDGKYLFFASDMPGGQGKFDLWYCEFINSDWSPPVNLGPSVNSPADEKYPYMHSSGKLYFSSDRQAGSGLDVYSTSLYYGKWDDPVRLPEPVNSSFNDFAFVASDNVSAGYFSSNRDGNDDIFNFKSNIRRSAECDTLRNNNFCYRFTELNAIKFDTVPFRFQWRFGDGTKAEGISVVHCFKGPGTYITRLDIVSLITKEVSYNEKIDTLVISVLEQPYISSPDQIKVGEQIKLNADSTNLPGWNITRYYWNFGDDTFDEGREVGKKFTTSGNYNVQLIVTGEAQMGEPAPEKCVFKKIVVSRQP
jgi:hypothetical protein